jgi:hypothetical protein
MDETKSRNNTPPQAATSRWRRFIGRGSKETPEGNEEPTYRAKSTLGILSDKQTDEVPGRWHALKLINISMQLTYALVLFYRNNPSPFSGSQ